MNKVKERSHNILIISVIFFPSFFLVRIAYSRLNLSHSEQEALSLTGLFIPSNTLVLIAFSDLDPHILPLSHSALSLSYASDSLSLSNPLNFSQFPLYASLFLPSSRCLAYFSVSLSPSCLTAQSSSLWKASPTWTWLSWTLIMVKQHSALSLTCKYDTNRGLPATLSHCLG